jgi:hypothetical protein
MAFERESFLNVLEDSYSAYYNIIKENLPAELPIAFKADYFRRAESYWISKNITTWANETNEFAFIFSADHFDDATISKCIQYSLDDGLPRVKPHKEHQYTNIKTIFIAEKFDDDAIADIKKRKFSKTYNHSLWGYSNLVACAVDLDDEKVWTNAAGRDLKKYFKKLFSAQKKLSCK